ncbi:MAG: VirB8/TrbF family protein [Rickettsiales bacterium]|nr:VirB8/TrbF family protein [Rickettsiales bacterium]
MQGKYEETLLQNRRLRILLLNLSITLIIALLTIFFVILKDKEVVRFVEFSQKGDFGVKVLESSEITESAKELIVVSQLKEYIKNRHEKLGGRKYNKGEFDLVKYNYVKALSSREVFSEYDAEFKRIHEEAQFYERDVYIISAVKEEKNKYLFTFDVVSYYEDQEEPVVNRFNVYVKFDYVNLNKISPSLRNMNPLGIQILWYRGDREKNNNEQAGNYDENENI